MSRSAASVTASLAKVPPFPPVAVRLLSLLASPSIDVAAVAELISSDATFTARLLQRVNSAAYGLLNPVTSVRQAVALLGIDLTRTIIVTHATASYAKGALGIEELRRCWEHTVATAVLAGEVAEACQQFTQIAFTAGIMHDIGRLGLLVAYPQDYEHIIRNAAERCLDLLDFEKEEFGLDHAEAGRILAERWGLPPDMAAIAGRHHDPCDGVELSLLRIVHVACRLADALGFDVVKPLHQLDMTTVTEELPARARARLLEDPAKIRELVEQRISEFGSSQTAPTPEETLALLSPAGTGEPEAAADDLQSSEPVEDGEPQEAKSYGPLIAGLIVAVIVVAVLVLWRFS